VFANSGRRISLKTSERARKISVTELLQSKLLICLHCSQRSRKYLFIAKGTTTNLRDTAPAAETGRTARRGPGTPERSDRVTPTANPRVGNNKQTNG
jgi:hypothetical protein